MIEKLLITHRDNLLFHSAIGENNMHHHMVVHYQDLQEVEQIDLVWLSDLWETKFP